MATKKVTTTTEVAAEVVNVSEIATRLPSASYALNI